MIYGTTSRGDVIKKNTTVLFGEKKKENIITINKLNFIAFIIKRIQHRFIEKQ